MEESMTNPKGKLKTGFNFINVKDQSAGHKSICRIISFNFIWQIIHSS